MPTGLLLDIILWSIRAVAWLGVGIRKLLHHVPEMFQDEVDLAGGAVDGAGKTDHELRWLDLLKSLHADRQRSRGDHWLPGKDELVLGGGEGGDTGCLTDDGAVVSQTWFIAEMLEETVSCAGW